MRRSLQLAVVAASILAGQRLNAASESAVLLEASQAAYPLKVGHATCDSFAGTRSNSAFLSLADGLKEICRPSRAAGPNGWRRPVDVEVAFGSEYQVLHWLQTERLDAAMVCPATLQLYDERMTNLVCLCPPAGTSYTFTHQPKLRSLSRSNGRWVPRPNPEGDYAAFLQSIAAAPAAGSAGTYRLVAPSHFSSGGFIAPAIYALRWWENSSRSSTDPRDSKAARRFWEAYLDRLEFSLGGQPERAVADGTNEATVLIEFASDDASGGRSAGTGWTLYTNTAFIALASLTNVLVVRSAIAQDLFAAPARDQWPRLANLDAAVAALRTNDAWKAVFPPRFKIAELLALVRQDQATSEQQELALVLSGGGVKAAYQSKLIDHLYSSKLLSNSTNPPPTALPVKSIVGNSGGALLGFFVAGLRADDPRKLSTILWQPGNQLVTDRDIFGFIDLPRWASFVVCAWIFSAVLRLTWRRKTPAGPPSGSEKAKRLPWFYSGAMLALLLLTPILLQIVNGEHGVEHVPAVEGLFYFLCLCLMLLFDNCLVPKKVWVDAGPSPRWKCFTSGTGLFAVGALMAALQLISKDREWSRTVLGDEVITVGGLAFSCEILVCWVGLVVWTIQQDRYALDEVAAYASMVIMTVGVIVLTYLTMWLLVLRGLITFLELTLEFWVALVILTMVWSLAYYWLGTAERCPPWCPRGFWRWAQRTFHHQCSRHPSSIFGLTRLVRMLLIFTFGFCYWNAVVAPAVYGNRQARRYLSDAAQRFTAQTNHYELQTLYAAPANDLAAKRERYFLFYPKREALSNTVEALKEVLNSDGRKRWTLLPFTPGGADMRRVVFASGSPFPIFSPHAILLPGAGRKERLVDGGFAHNVPLEAAKQIGARQLLVLNPSPAEIPASTKTNEAVFGQLSRNLPRLVPFLFERSQVADLLSQEDMFIVSLSPRYERDWPSLFDFRQRTVMRLLDTAERDTTNRIGRIEAYGVPVFRTLIRMSSNP